jgi:hypothetical protein
MGARREARRALAAAGIRPRKRWGQHFLCDPGVARHIAETAEIGPRSVVLEIGPGLGALSDELVARAGRVYLVEIDRALAARLAERYAGDPRVRVLEGDVLEVPLAELVPERGATVVANLPYGIASPILFRLLDLRAHFPRAVLMLQREMAHRLAARPGTRDYGVASVLDAGVRRGAHRLPGCRGGASSPCRRSTRPWSTSAGARRRASTWTTSRPSAPSCARLRPAPQDAAQRARRARGRARPHCRGGVCACGRRSDGRA